MYLSPSVLLRSPLTIRLQLACVLAAACVGLVCAGERARSGEGASADTSPTTPPTSQQAGAQQDSSAIARYVRAQGFGPLFQILAQQDTYYAIYTENATTEERHLLFLRVQRDSVASLLDPIELGFMGRPYLTDWVSLTGKDLDGLLITYFDVWEGFIGTTIFEVTDDKLRRIYVDGNGCRPAEMRDIDGDGWPELISVVEDPLDGDHCTSFCHEYLWSQFSVVPGWVRIQRWTGEDWIPVEREFPGFYHDLAGIYQSIDEVLRGPGSDYCPYADWLRGEKRDYFARLAARALEVATAGQDTLP